MKILKGLILIMLISTGFESMATHLMGGSLTYTFLSYKNPGGGVTYSSYRVTLKIYRDCSPRADGKDPVGFDDNIQLGVYYNDAARNLYQSVTSSQVHETKIDPPWDNNCPNKPSYCVMEGIYEWTIDLPAYSGGYHLYWTRCCRNQQENIEWEMGQGYYAFVPPTNIKNNSPYFTQLPVPFICLGDTVDFPNSTTDTDGDSLVYSFQRPYNGGDANNPSPVPDQNLADPLPTVQYQSGFSVAKPFGANGYATINPATGLCKYFIPALGNYSVAVEVKEYRKGVLIGIVRRDVQLIVTDKCQKNNPPRLAAGTATSYSVIEGEQLCFDIKFTDTPSQTITLKGWGDPIDGTGRVNKSPYATKINTSGTGSVTQQFCWTPACGLNSTQPYFVSVEAKDDGCPYKSTIVDFFITVKPFDAKGEIKGKDTVCLNASTDYTAKNKPGYQYNWTVENATIQSGQGTSAITVTWNGLGSGRVMLTEKNALGCESKPDTVNVTILPPTLVKPITGDTIVCEYEKGLVYSIPFTAGSKYDWYIQNGTITSGLNTNSVTIDWGARWDGRVVVIETNQYGCPSDSMVKPILISAPVTTPIDGSPSVCPNIDGVLYQVDNTPGSQYFWFVQGGTQAAGGTTNQIRVNWGSPGNGMVKVVEINQYGCIGDTIYFPVIINWKLAGMQPIGDSVVCAFTTNVSYEVHYTNHSSYSWVVMGGTLTQGNGSNSILVDWGQPGSGFVIVTETSYDSISNMPCFSDPDTLPVRIAKLPSATTITGDFDFCESTKLSLFGTTGNPGSTYVWTLDGDTVGTSADTLSLAFPVAGSYTLAFTEITADSCIGQVFDSVVIVHPVPKTTPITGDTNICFPTFDGHAYSTTGLAQSTFTWAAENGTISSGQGTPDVVINWNGKNPAMASVVEVSEFGCAGDTVKLNVFLDHPSISLDYVTVGIQNDQVIEVYWHLVDAPRYNSKILVYKRAAGASTFRFADSVSADKSSYTDIKVDVHDTAYEYMLKGFDLCGNELTSTTHTSILLEGNKFSGDSSYDSWLQWTRYYGWPRGVLNYEVLRKAGEEYGFELYEAKNDTGSYYENGLEAFTQCYRIKGLQRSGSFMSYSNTICINFDPVVWIPNAFTPNDDFLNDQFLLKGGALKHFDIKIYNRWGELMFESDSLDKSWDGTFFGKPCQMDVYVYVVKFWGADEVLQTRTGDIHLLR